MAKKKITPPATNRLKFDQPMNQKGDNVAKAIDSTAVRYLSYNPKTERMQIAYEGSVNPTMYTYRNVPPAQAQKVLDAAYPRLRQGPARKDSVGASVNRAIIEKGYPYTRRIMTENQKAEVDKINKNEPME